MSMMRCDRCCRAVDTDEDLECYDPGLTVGAFDCVCEWCRERNESLKELIEPNEVTT